MVTARIKETGKFTKPIAPPKISKPKASKETVEKILHRTVTASQEEIFGNIGKIVKGAKAKKK